MNLNNIDAKAKEVKKDYVKLSSWARDYNNRYLGEIEEGTKKKQLLLAEGLSKGKNRETIDFGPNFIPSNDTPILNFLFFHKRDEHYEELEVLREIKDVGKKEEYLREHYNKSISDGKIDGKLDKFEEKLQPNLGTLLYGDVTLEMFDKIKKLKSLSKSPNKEEAFSAYSKCMDLCNKHGLEFDKIRCEV